MMSMQEAISHWREGAVEALKWAERMSDENSNALAIFHCHLAVEKALKASYMEKNEAPAPRTHSLTHLATLVNTAWSDEELEQLQELSPFSAEARYDDIGWVEKQANSEFVKRWVGRTKVFLSKLNCAVNS